MNTLVMLLDWAAAIVAIGIAEVAVGGLVGKCIAGPTKAQAEMLRKRSLEQEQAHKGNWEHRFLEVLRNGKHSLTLLPKW